MTMKKILLMILPLLCMTLAGCTENNGDIGSLFGFWRLTALEIDGEPDPDIHPGEYVWAFQGHVLEITINGNHHDSDRFYGSFADHGNELELDFTHWQTSEDFSFQYHMPPAMKLPDDAPVTLQIQSRSDSHMTLVYGSQTYRLTKAY